MSQNLILVRTSGRATAPVIVSAVRELVHADVELLAAGKGVTVSPIVRIRDSHHSLARLVADGREFVEISAITGYTRGWISTLCRDPSFAELVEFYRAEKREVVGDVEVKLKLLLEDTLQELRERMDEKPESFNIPDLHDQVKLLADRTGHGPSSKTTSVNVHLGLADRMANALKRVHEARPPVLNLEVDK